MNTHIYSAIVPPSLTGISLALSKPVRSFPWKTCDRTDLLMLPVVALYLMMLLVGATLFRGIDWLESLAGAVALRRHPPAGSLRHPSYP